MFHRVKRVLILSVLGFLSVGQVPHQARAFSTSEVAAVVPFDTGGYFVLHVFTTAGDYWGIRTDGTSEFRGNVLASVGGQVAAVAALDTGDYFVFNVFTTTGDYVAARSDGSVEGRGNVIGNTSQVVSSVAAYDSGEYFVLHLLSTTGEYWAVRADGFSEFRGNVLGAPAVNAPFGGIPSESWGRLKTMHRR